VTKSATAESLMASQIEVFLLERMKEVLDGVSSRLFKRISS